MSIAFRPIHGTLCLIAALIFAASAGSAHSATSTVCPTGCDHTTIQAAVDAAADGDTIEVGAGTYVENVVVYRDLAIVGAGIGETIVDGDAAGHVFDVIGVPLLLRGMTIRNGMSYAGGGVAVFNEADVTLDQCEVRENRATNSGGGIYIDTGEVRSRPTRSQATTRASTVAGSSTSTAR